MFLKWKRDYDERRSWVKKAEYAGVTYSVFRTGPCPTLEIVDEAGPEKFIFTDDKLVADVVSSIDTWCESGRPFCAKDAVRAGGTLC